MQSLRRSFAITILLSCGLAFAGDSAKSLLSKGWDAEQRQDYEKAYEYYKQAYDKRPGDLKYRVAVERTRFLAAAFEIRRGQKLRDQGKLPEALELFKKAADTDPSNDLAQQEMKRTQEMMAHPAGPGAQQQGPVPPQSQADDQLRKMLDKAQGPVQLGDISNAPLSAIQMNSADSKQAYETIGKIAGINVLFDPDYTSRKIPVSLKDVTLQQALDIVALESHTFWRPVTPNTIFVATDNTGKRRELEQSVIKTFYLGNVASPTDLQDVVNAIRTILEVQRIQQIPSQNAIIVRGTPDQLALAQKMIDDIDKSKPEVVIDVVVAQVRRDKVRQLGLLPPQQASVALQGSTTVTTTTTGTTTTNVPNNNNGLNFNSLQHLNSGNYAVSIPALQAEAIMTDSNTKILENPQIRAADGQKATLKVGDRIPVATGSFGTPLGIGTGVGALGVNTQFQYIDVGVTIDITPHVHPDNEISLKAMMTISNQTGTSSIGGISQPIISQRNIEHEIRLQDGEANLVGGILEDEVDLNSNGLPFVSKIPLLKYLFSQEDKERHTNEVVFLLIPHIVRGQMLSSLNRKAFDVGSGTAIGLRMADNGVPRGESRARPPQPGVTPAADQPAYAQQPAIAPQQPVIPQQQQAAVSSQQPVVAQEPAITPQPAAAVAQQPPVVAQQIPAPQAEQPTFAQQQQQQTAMEPAILTRQQMRAARAAQAAAQQPPAQQPAAQQPAVTAPAAAIQGSQNFVAPPSASEPANVPAKIPAGEAAKSPISLKLDPGVVSAAVNGNVSLNISVAGGQDVSSLSVQLTYDPKALQFAQVTPGNFLGRDGQAVPWVHRDDPNTGTLVISAQRPQGATGISGDGVAFNLSFTAKTRGATGIAITVPKVRDSQNQPLTALGSQTTINVN